MTELIWDGKYDKNGKKCAPLRVALPFQTVETVNESALERDRTLDMFAAGRESEWRNRLIWGDKKYVLPSLLPELAGKVNLIYIDPPFATGADFSFNTTVPDSDRSFTKEPSVIEQKAYRDTWGKGLDSYLKWFYETVVILRELLVDQGCIYVHLDNNVGHYAKAVLDEVFGTDNFRNEIVVKRPISKNLQAQFSTVTSLSTGHDTLFWFSKSSITRYKPIYMQYDTTKPEGYWHHFWSNADRPNLRYELLGITPQSGQWKYNKNRALLAAANYEDYVKLAAGRSLAEYWVDTGQQLEFIRLSKSRKVENWFPPSSKKLADTLWLDVNAYPNEKTYATEKHEALLERIISASSNPGDLVLDCFCGSGTTAAVAEKLGRRWVTCDLGRFAIHTARKRLLGIEGVKPFVVQNLGKYERQQWQAAEFGEAAEEKLRAYRDFILSLYHARPITGYVWLHGIKAGRMVHVGGVDSPVSVGDVQQIAVEFRKAMGTGKDAPSETSVDVLGWDFAFEINEVAKQQAALAGIDVRFVRIPREVLEKKAVEQGDIKFFELAALAVDLSVAQRVASLHLTDFTIPLDDVPDDVRRAVTHWEQWIDYWAVDWDNKGDAFHNMWQSYRTRKDKSLQKRITHRYEEPGEYKVFVKLIDIMGNDTTKTVWVSIA